jgi:Tol biopolymer transport system component
MKRRLTLALLLALPACGLAAWLVLRRASELPAALTGAIVFVSDRDGTPALYWRRLPKDRERRLTFGSEPVVDPAISPDGTRIAFAMNGRIGVVAVAGGEPAILTLAVDWKDQQPAWLPDGRRLVVSSRRRAGEPAGLHLLEPQADGSLVRSPLTQPRAGDDGSPRPSPDGAWVLFVRDERLMRVDLADGRVRRLSGGFKRDRAPRFLPDGRIVCAWSEGKRHGIDRLEPDGRGRETLSSGGRFYSALAPSPDGRYLAATLAYDMGLHPLAALVGSERESLRLLDAAGLELAPLAASSRHASHSADWGR